MDRSSPLYREICINRGTVTAPKFEMASLLQGQVYSSASQFLDVHHVRLIHTEDTINMITKFMTEITARFNPFSACAKPARLFLTLLPPNARTSGTTISTTLLPRASTEPSSVAVKFSTYLAICLTGRAVCDAEGCAY